MKSLRKSFLTLLALTLFGGAGAWAQGPTAAEINSDLYSGWTSLDGRLFKASELPGFQAVTEDQAKSWTGVPSTGHVILYYEFVADGNVKAVGFVNGVYEGSYEDNDLRCYDIYEDIAYNGDKRYFYTTGGGAIELTKEGANQWSLGQAPDYDLELQVEYYEAHALKNIPAGWTVKVNGVEQPKPYQGDSLMITETDSVTLIPDNPRRVKSVTLEEVVSLAPPLTMEALTAGTIVVNSPKSGMQYSKNGGAKTAMNATTTINVAAGDKVAFYGNGTSITQYFTSNSNYTKIAGGTAKVKVYGNIMSLVDEENFATATTLSDYAFRKLFDGNATLTDASELLLPATTLAQTCYGGMFMNCSTLVAAPALPATTLASYCYNSMFGNCTALTTAPELPATTLVHYCYFQMFYNCSKLSSVTCLATSIDATNCITNWLQNAGTNAATKTLHVKASMGTASWYNENFTVTPDQP